MPFVKLDCGILDSTLWADRLAKELFITALLMAEPIEIREPMQVLNGSSLMEDLHFKEIPVGWYGFVAAAGPGIIRRAGIEDKSANLALLRLAEPDYQSRSPAFQGRRMVRVDGGYIILNFDKYRTKDHTAAERAKRYRERKASRVTNEMSRVTSRKQKQSTEAETDKETRVPVNNWLTEDDLWIELQRILSETEVKNHIGIWISRIKENRGALYEAICDFKDKRNQRKIKNVGAWLTQRYQHFKNLDAQRKGRVVSTSPLR